MKQVPVRMPPTCRKSLTNFITILSLAKTLAPLGMMLKHYWINKE
jgi:hypothetical protein